MGFRREVITKLILAAVGDGVSTQVAEIRPTRQYLIIQCDLATGFPLRVTFSAYAKTGNDIVTFDLEPGESVVFSRWGSMPWFDAVNVAGIGGTAGVRGGDVYTREG